MIWDFLLVIGTAAIGAVFATYALAFAMWLADDGANDETKPPIEIEVSDEAYKALVKALADDREPTDALKKAFRDRRSGHE